MIETQKSRKFKKCKSLKVTNGKVEEKRYKKKEIEK